MPAFSRSVVQAGAFVFEQVFDHSGLPSVRNWKAPVYLRKHLHTADAMCSAPRCDDSNNPNPIGTSLGIA
jgi:hypothetical protein